MSRSFRFLCLSPFSSWLLTDPSRFLLPPYPSSHRLIPPLTLNSLSKEAFDTDRGLWLATQEQELYPNPHSYARESTQLSWYTFIGRILGKALYDGILIDVRFASFFLSKVSC